MNQKLGLILLFCGFVLLLEPFEATALSGNHVYELIPARRLMRSESQIATIPPATKGSIPPATKGSTPPATKGSTPPATKDSIPPAIKGSIPPATKGSIPPKQDSTPTKKGSYIKSKQLRAAFYHTWGPDAISYPEYYSLYTYPEYYPLYPPSHNYGNLRYNYAVLPWWKYKKHFG